MPPPSEIHDLKRLLDSTFVINCQVIWWVKYIKQTPVFP